MILPIHTSIRPRQTPYVNYALIAINVIIFLLSYSPHAVRMGLLIVEEPLRVWAQHFKLTPERPFLWQFITYAFLHGGYLHIIGNMFFLYIFGNNVNDKLGGIGYLCLYLAGAVFSGIGHTLLSDSSVLGASGAVAAITGAYLVLFPQTLITVVYWFFFIGTFEVPALYFIGLKMVLIDNILAASSPYIAYNAHLSGYAFGIGAVLILLATGLISRSQFDLWSILRQWNRRRQYRDVVSGGYDPFIGRAGHKPVKAKEVKKTPAEKAQYEKIMQIRGKIAHLLSQRNLQEAAELYLQLLEIDQEHVLPRQHQLDIANQLMSMGRWSESAHAYEKFLAHYKSYEYAEQVYLMLGVLYCRYLDQPKQAAQCLKTARKKLTDPGQIKMCDDELARLED